VQTSQSVLPTIQDQAITEQLSVTSQKLNTDLSDLRGALSRAKPVCQGLGLGAASQLIADLQDELNEFERAVKAHNLKPLPGDTPERGAEDLTSSSKAINQSVAQLLSAAAQGNEIYTDKAARDTAQSLRSLTGAVRTVAATTGDENVQLKVIGSGQDVLMHSARLVEEAQKTLHSVEVTPGLQHAAKKISTALNQAINCLPGGFQFFFTRLVLIANCFILKAKEMSIPPSPTSSSGRPPSILDVSLTPTRVTESCNKN
jgi:talin